MQERVAGATKWLIPDCYYPEVSTPFAYPSHESICVLNTSSQQATISFTFYFEDREPMHGKALCAAQRTHHVRLDALVCIEGTLPKGIPYAAMIESDVPVVVQYSRCDSSHPAQTLMTTMAFPV